MVSSYGGGRYMNEMTLEERVESLECAVYTLIQMVNKLRENSTEMDVKSMVEELKFLDGHISVVTKLREAKI